MSRRKIVFAALLTLLTPAWTGAAGQGKPDSPLRWLHQPEYEQLLAAFPQSAFDKHLTYGKAVIVCDATVEGTLGACKVESEAPQNSGFGQAALAMAPQFLFEPAIRNGVPVAVRVTIPIVWTLGEGNHVGTNVSHGDMSVDKHLMFSHVNWIKSPSYTEVEAAFPAKARAAGVGGYGLLNCTLNDQGRLFGCTASKDNPEGYGFANAALNLANRFQAPSKLPDGKSVASSFVSVQVLFPKEFLQPGPQYVTTAKWNAVPTGEMFAKSFPAAAKAAGVGTSRVLLSCSVGAGGEMSDCAIKEETPAGLGFGAAALALAPQFVMQQWTDDGQAMVGRKINLPVSYKMDVKGPPTAGGQPAAKGPATSAPAG